MTGAAGVDASLFGPRGEPPSAETLFARFNQGDDGALIGLDKKEFGRMLLALTGSTYGTAEQFTRFVDGEFRVADMDRDGLVCEDEFYLYYWKRVIFIVPPALGTSGDSHLHEIFVNFCSQGSAVRMERMGCTTWRRLCKRCGLLASGGEGLEASRAHRALRRRGCTLGDADIAFKTVIGRYRKAEGERETRQELNYGQFLEALHVIADKRREGLSDTIRAVLRSKKLPEALPSAMDFVTFAEDDYTHETAATPPALRGPGDVAAAESPAAAPGDPTANDAAAADEAAAAGTSPGMTQLSLGYQGVGTARWHMYLHPDQLMPYLYKVFKMYSVTNDAGSIIGLEWIEMQSLMRNAGIVGTGMMTLAELERFYVRAKSSKDASMHFHQFMQCLKTLAAHLRLSLNEVVERLVVHLYPRAMRVEAYQNKAGQQNVADAVEALDTRLPVVAQPHTEAPQPPASFAEWKKDHPSQAGKHADEVEWGTRQAELDTTAAAARGASEPAGKAGSGGATGGAAELSTKSGPAAPTAAGAAETAGKAGPAVAAVGAQEPASKAGPAGAAAGGAAAPAPAAGSATAAVGATEVAPKAAVGATEAAPKGGLATATGDAAAPAPTAGSAAAATVPGSTDDAATASQELPGTSPNPGKKKGKGRRRK